VILTKFRAMVISVILLASVLVLSTGLNNREAYAANDANGIELKQPLSGWTLTYNSQYFDSSSAYKEDFRRDGSMRMHFIGVDTRSVMLAGYFKLSAGSCTNDLNEELGAELNGGYHTSRNPVPLGEQVTTPMPNENYADTMHLSADFEGRDARVRWEKTHPFYSTGISPDQTTLPLSRNMCSPPNGGWVGGMWFKLNLDDNCNGTTDRIALIMYVDVSGLDANGKPRNQWELVYYKIHTLSSIDLKGKATPWVISKGLPSQYWYQTIRIDQQSQSDWNDQGNEKFETLKKVAITKNGC
jgi:hypothetical protein